MNHEEKTLIPARTLNSPLPEDAGIIRDEKGRFVPGVSGHPEGRKKGAVSITAAIQRKLLEVFPEKRPGDNKEKKLYLDKLVERILENAIENGEGRTQKDIWAYMDGAPKATLDIGADKESINELTDFFRAIAKK